MATLVVGFVLVIGIAWLGLLRPSSTRTPTRSAPQLDAPANTRGASVSSEASLTAAATTRTLQTPGNPIDSFEDWVQTYLSASDDERGRLELIGLELAQARRAALRELIESDPERAWESRVRWAARKELPAEIQEQLEDVVSARGDLEVLGAIPYANQTSKFRSIVRWATFPEKSYAAFVYGRTATLPTRHNVSLHGIAIDGVLAVADSPLRVLDPGEPPGQGKAPAADLCPVSGKSTVDSRPETAPVTVESGDEVFRLCDPTHAAALGDELWQQEIAFTSWQAFTRAGTASTNSVLVMIVDFPDRPGANTTASNAIDVMNEVSEFYRACSFQQFFLEPVGVTPVLRLPRASTEYVQSSSLLLQDARNMAWTFGYDSSRYHFDVVTFQHLGFPWGGLGYIGGKGAFVQGLAFLARTVKHELGHNFGVWHAGGWVTDDESIIGPGRRLEYGHEFDIMGSGGGHLNTAFKTALGWLPEANAVTASVNGIYRLHTMDAGQPLSPSRAYALRVPPGSALHGLPSDYWIEFRQQFTNNPLAMSGALVHWATDATGPDQCQLLDMNPAGVSGFRDAPLVVGQTFADSGRGIFITPLAKGGTAADAWMDVDVRFRPTNASSPVVLLTASAVTVNPGETVQFTATASDMDGDTLAYRWDFGDRSVPEANLNQSVANKSWPAAGEYVVRCTVSDLKGGEASASVLVRVGNPTGFRIAGHVLWRGYPLHGVHIYNGLTGPDYRGAFTDSDGRFALVGLAATYYMLHASKPGFFFAPAFTNPVTVGPDHVEDLVFRAETNTAMLLMNLVPPGGFIGASVAIRGINLHPPAWPDGVTFGGVPAAFTFNSSTQITAVVPDGASSGPVVVRSAWYGGYYATSDVPFTVFPTPPGIRVQPRNHTNGSGFTVTFKVTASGSAPFAYQWRKDGVDLPQAIDRLLTITNIQFQDAGGYQVVVANSAGSVTSAVATLAVLDAINFEEALETTGLVWTTGGDEGWRTQTNSTFDGIDAAESGYLVDSSEASWLETTVSGPGLLRFRYLKPSQLSLSLSHWSAAGGTTNKVDLHAINPGLWMPAEIRIPAGDRTVRWTARNGSTNLAQRALVDEVSFTPGLPPLILMPPRPTIVPEGESAPLSVVADGSAPLYYQWSFRGDPVPGATNRNYTITDLSADDTGFYSVRVWNAFGEAQSSSAYVEVVGPPIPSLSVSSEVQAGDIPVAITVWSPFDIARLEVFDGSTTLVNATNPVGGSWFPLTLSNVPPGRRLSLSAVATDGAGQRGTSATVNVSVVLRLIPQGSLWKYLDTRNGPAPGWREVDFDDSNWPLGVAAFGYPPGTPDLVTGLNYGPDSTNKFITAWFRRGFPVSDPASLSNAVLWLRRDDGAVVYLNGAEIFRSNLPDGPIEPITLASAAIEASEETAFFPQRVPAHLFLSGTNVIAVEVHQIDPASDDLVFDLKLTAYLPPLPSVAITSPGSDDSLMGPTIPIRAVAVSPDGEIVRVEFFAQGIKIGEDTTAPYGIVWFNAPLYQQYATLTAKATDTNGNTSISAPFYIRLVGPPGTVPLMHLIDWRFIDDGSAPDLRWRDLDFDSEDWKVGPAPLGAASSANTILNIGPPDARHPITYFRAALNFDLFSPPQFTNFTLYLFCELGDGAIVYVNGAEVFRSYLPAGTISNSTYTGHPSGGLGWLQAPVDPGPLGEYNIIAVEMHQNLPDSAQLVFDLALIGHLDMSPPPLTLETSDQGLHLRWEGKWYWDLADGDWYWWSGRLEEADVITGPWRLADEFATGGYFIPDNVPQRFFRLRWP